MIVFNVQQDDVIRHITDALKAGEQLTTFRKEKIGSDENGITYWYKSLNNFGAY